MKFENLFHIILFSFLVLTSCSGKQSPVALGSDVYINLSHDSSAIELHRISKDVLDYFRSENIKKKEWESFFAVYSNPIDEELRDFQPPIEGKYSIMDSLIIFKPETDFKPDSSYFARCYSHNLLSKPSDIMVGKNFTGQKPVAELIFVR